MEMVCVYILQKNEIHKKNKFFERASVIKNFSYNNFYLNFYFLYFPNGIANISFLVGK